MCSAAFVALACALFVATPATAAPPTPVSESEGNGTTGTADLLAAGCMAFGSGAIAAIGDVDFWAFRAEAGDRVWVHVSTGSSTTGTDSVLQLLAPDGTTVIEADDDDGPGLESMIAAAPVTVTGLHYLRINEFADNSTITPYRLQLSVTSEDAAESEPNDPDAEAAPPCGHSMFGTVEAGQVDRYELGLEQNDRLSVVVDDDPDEDASRTDVVITLEGPEGVVLQSTTTQGFAFDVPATGRHVVRLEGGSGSGSYRFVATTADLEGESEANNATAGADPLGSGCQVSGTGAISPVGDVDFWSFQALAGDHVWSYIETAASVVSTDSVLELIAPNGTSVLETDDDDGPGLSSLIAGHGLGTGGTHYLRVSEFADNSTIDPYTGHVSVTTETESESEPNDEEPQRGPDCETRVRGEIGAPADADRYSLDLTPGERLFAALDDDPERDSVRTPLRLTLKAPDGSTIETTMTDAIAERVASGGTYELLVEGLGTTGSYALHVSSGEPPPNTSIDTGPAEGSTITETAPTFGFSSDEAGAIFECRLDGGAFASCTPPHTLPAPGDGTHTFAVRALDDGRPDPDPATRTFTIDSTPPQTFIDFGPAEGATIASRTPAFAFSASEAGSSFECRIDREGFRPCVSPDTLSPVVDGAHTFAVRATDAAGNTDPEPASRSFVVATSPAAATPDSGPSALVPDTSAPDLSVFGSRRQSSRRIRIALLCAEPCVAVVSGRVVAVAPKGASSGARSAGRRRKKYSLKRVTRTLDAGTRETVRVKLRRNRSSVRRLRRLIRRGWTAKARIRVVATDGAGNRTTDTRVVRLRR